MSGRDLKELRKIKCLSNLSTNVSLDDLNNIAKTITTLT